MGSSIRVVRQQATYETAPPSSTSLAGVEGLAINDPWGAGPLVMNGLLSASASGDVPSAGLSLAVTLLTRGA
jgi:hypothetical protein